MFWGIGNHLGSCSEDSDRPEGREQDGGAVGGQEALQGVKYRQGQEQTVHAVGGQGQLQEVKF